VIAEGVENEKQLTILRELECHHGQGIHFSYPVEAATAQRLIVQKPRW
jgi:EAL domain-containing protein (putative c-di-GMP-specific phosphodiesterase class I)